MKEMKMAILAIIAILSFSLLIMGCPNDTEKPADEGYKNLKLNEVSGVGTDSEKFYELINTGAKDIQLEGCKIYYNANGSTGGALPSGKGTLTWTGLSTQTIEAGKLFSLIGRDNPLGTNPGSFTTGLTAERILIITLEDPDGNVIDKCVRAADTGSYAFTDKSFSRIPDGTGDFYFTTPTPNATNGTSTSFPKVPAVAPAPPANVDYSNLKLNEVSGVGADSEKFYELINTGTKDIQLEGCKIYYNANGVTGGTLPSGKGNLTWTGLSTQTIEAGKLFSLIGRDNPLGTNPGSFTTGLTAGRILRITLEDPAGNKIDECIRAADTGSYAFTDKSFSRIPDGTGDFYFTTPSPNKTNPTSSSELTKVPVNPGVPPSPPVTGADYTKLVLNEVSGNNKFVEIYNSGTVAIPMEGVRLLRNDGQSGWLGTASDSIPAGAYRLFLFNNYTPADLNTNPAYTGWTVSSGISSGQILKVAIVDPSGNPVSVFIRGENPLPAWGNSSGVTQDSTYSYSRMSDGTWAYAAPTPGAANGAKAGDIVSPRYLTAQP